jgi:CubicO group peptidase (beta-lactamase class C family)
MNYENLRYLKPVMQREIDHGEVCGSAIRVIHENKTVYEDVLGYADRARGIPMAKDTIFRLYSMTKPITAVAVMLLYERGAVNLLDPVSAYLEGFAARRSRQRTGWLMRSGM